MTPPPSQRYRQIAFYLSGGNGPDVNFTFALRPEELSREEPSRATIQQTLGGAWIDVFDEGVKTISLSGHNGWRGGLLLSGEDLFQSLRTTVFAEWHARRRQLVSQGQDPSVVTLTFADNLDDISSIVVPMSFTLRRSRTRPLLIVYQIQLLELGPAGAAVSLLDAIINALSNPERWILAQTGLGDVATSLQSYVTEAENVLGAAGGAAGAFVGMTTGLLTSIASVAQTVQGQFDSSVSTLLSIGTAVAQAGAGAFAALAGTNATLDAADLISVMNLSQAYNGAACLMANGFNSETSYLSFDALLGASGCSSTSGGEPPNPFTVAGANPLDDLFAASAAPIAASPNAVSALAFLSSDPLLLIGQQTAIASAMTTAANGITLI